MKAILTLLALCMTFTIHASGSPTPWQTGQSTRSVIDEALEQARPLIQEALALAAQGDSSGTRDAMKRADEILSTLEGAKDNEELSEALWNLGNIALRVKDYHLARRALEQVLEYREEHLDPDDDRIMRARGNLSVACYYVGDLEAALALDRENLAFVTRVLPADHLDLQRARLNLAASLLEVGETNEALSLLEQAVAVLEETVPASHSQLVQARLNLGVALARRRHHARAAGVFAKILEALEGSLPPEHPDLQRARINLAAMLGSAGDYAASHALHGKVLDTYAQLGIEDDPELHKARVHFALQCLMIGDLDGSEALLRKVVALEESVLPHGHATRLLAQKSLAIVLKSAGEFAEAEALMAGLLEQLGSALPPNHRSVLSAEATLSSIVMKTGDQARAQAIHRKLLEKWSKTYPPEHEFMIRLKSNMAQTATAKGDHERARELTDELIALCEANFPVDDSLRRKLYHDAARRLAASADENTLEELSSLLDRALAGERMWVRGLVVLSPRLARETAIKGSYAISRWLTLSDLVEDKRAEHESQLFALVEEIRSLTNGGIHASPGSRVSAEVEELHEHAFALRKRVNTMAASLGNPEEKERSSAQEIAEAVLERDSAIAGLRRVLVASGLASQTIDAAKLGKHLPQGSAAIGFRAYQKSEQSGALREWMTAFVVNSKGALTRVDLGPLAPIADATRRWRAAIGHASGRGTGLGSRGETPMGEERAAGSALRVLALDPVLEAAGDAQVLHICADDVLRLVPLDALPLADGAVGDRFVIHNEVSFARLLSEREWSPGDPTLLTVGGVNFDASVAANSALEPIAAAPVNLSRGSFPALPDTLAEAEWLGDTFGRQFEVDSTLLIGAEATREAFSRNAPNSRYIHLATHGYFADESVASWADVAATGTDWERERGSQVVRGMAPMTLCGLALAGANSGMDSVGRVPGILTAEELAGLDLSGCELAVLSACETSVGKKKSPGQGIRSLQSALHSAGARTAITSLWRVDDEWTRKLMEEFYERMWGKGEGKARALWNAKCTLRAAGASVRDWSPWVLTGEPE